MHVCVNACVCMRVCVCVCVFMCVQVTVHMCVWRPEVGDRYLLSFFIFVFKPA